MSLKLYVWECSGLGSFAVIAETQEEAEVAIRSFLREQKIFLGRMPFPDGFYGPTIYSQGQVMWAEQG